MGKKMSESVLRYATKYITQNAKNNVGENVSVEPEKMSGRMSEKMFRVHTLI